MKRERYLYGLVGLIIILVSLIVILIGIRGYRKFPENIYQEGFEKIQEIEELLKTGENEKLEFKSSLRWNLKTNKPDKEQELQVMKKIEPFMNKVSRLTSFLILISFTLFIHAPAYGEGGEEGQNIADGRISQEDDEVENEQLAAQQAGPGRPGGKHRSALNVE